MLLTFVQGIYSTPPLRHRLASRRDSTRSVDSGTYGELPLEQFSTYKRISVLFSAVRRTRYTSAAVRMSIALVSPVHVTRFASLPSTPNERAAGTGRRAASEP